MRSIAIRTSTRRSSSRRSRLRSSRPPRSTTAKKQDIVVTIDRETARFSGTHNGVPLDPEETVGRIGAQTAKQVMIQKIREAERDALYDEYHELIGQMVTGVVQRYEGGAATVSLGNVEAILPRSEQIPGETHHANERVRATVFEVRKAGSRVKVILSRTRPQLVQRLFEQEIPEIADGVIEIRAMAREPGYRSKVAVSSTDQRVDCVGACVGVRGNRIKNIVDELAGERIDIVRWSDDLQVLIPNALQPAEVEEVILCQMLGRAIVLVREDQLSLAIGRRGQNVRLASKLCGWDIEIMTREELDEQIERAVAGFCALEGVDDELAERLVGEGFLSLRRPVGHRARRADGDGRVSPRSRSTRSSIRPKPRPKRPKPRPPQNAAGSASRNGSTRPRPRPMQAEAALPRRGRRGGRSSRAEDSRRRAGRRRSRRGQQPPKAAADRRAERTDRQQTQHSRPRTMSIKS